MSNKNLTIGLLVAIVIAIGGYMFPQIKSGMVSGTVSPTDVQATNFTEVTASNGMLITAGGLTTNTLTTSGTINSTSTSGTANTLTQFDLNGFSEVAVTINVSTLTWTLPASSTLTTFIPLSGNKTIITFANATTTAAANLTLAGGTGTFLSTASSTRNVNSDRSAELSCVRLPSTDVQCNLLN